MHTASGYRATREDGKLIVHGVPIFAECQRAPTQRGDDAPCFDGNFDATWIAAAAKKAMTRYRDDNYKGPLHIRHHGETLGDEQVRPAGTFRVIGTKVIRYEGKARLAILADLIITDPQAQFEVMESRLPFRSVEILDIDAAPSIDSVALLDHEVPFLRLPNLEIGDLNDRDQSGDPVPCGTFAQPWAMETLAKPGPMVACFSRGTRAALLFEDPMAKPTKQTGKKPPMTFGDGVTDSVPVTAGHISTNNKFTADDDEKKDPNGDGEELEADDGFDVGPIVKAIEDRSISLADMDALEAAIRKARAAAIDEEVPADEPVAPAAVPGGEAMTADKTLIQQFAALTAKVATQGATIASLEGASARDKAVAAAVERLKGREILGDLEGDLTKFHADHGAAAFTTFVDSLAKHNAVMPEDTSAPTATGAAHPEAMKFSAKGAEAVAKADGYVKQWKWHKTNSPRMTTTLEEYVAINMEEAGYSEEAV